MSSCRSHLKSSQTRFPDRCSGRPDPNQPYRWLEYGSASDLPQARTFWSDAAGGRPCSGSAICPRLINPVGFDKAKPPAVWRTLTIEGAFGGRFAACTAIDRIFSGQVYQLFGRESGNDRRNPGSDVVGVASVCERSSQLLHADGGQPDDPRFQLDRNVAVEVARREAIRQIQPRKSPAAMAGLFDF